MKGFVLEKKKKSIPGMEGQRSLVPPPRPSFTFIVQVNAKYGWIKKQSTQNHIKKDFVYDLKIYHHSRYELSIHNRRMWEHDKDRYNLTKLSLSLSHSFLNNCREKLLSHSNQSKCLYIINIIHYNKIFCICTK